MGHAVDRDLLCLVQDELKDLIKDYNTIHSQLNQHNKQIAQLEVNVATLTDQDQRKDCLLYTSPSPRDGLLSRMPSSA